MDKRLKKAVIIFVAGAGIIIVIGIITQLLQLTATGPVGRRPGRVASLSGIQIIFAGVTMIAFTLVILRTLNKKKDKDN